VKDVVVRIYRPEDESAIKEITYQTGFKGENLAGRKYFDDKHLLYLIFIYYYPNFEPKHCFVAENTTTGAVVGFICGTPDTHQQEKRFKKTIPWRIFVWTFTFTIWRYPKTFATLLKMAKMIPSIDPKGFSEIIKTYPAHLHINLLPKYQRKGLGTRMIQIFENHLKDLCVPGVHLQTTNYNKKAIPFYIKQDYQLVNDVPLKHFLYDDLKQLTFAKAFKD
jgi:ribosomal protein S18 acetylase RimI-like enzyme